MGVKIDLKPGTDRRILGHVDQDGIQLETGEHVAINTIEINEIDTHHAPVVKPDTTIIYEDRIGESNYNKLDNLPSINSIVLTGNKTLEELGIQAAGDYATKDEIPKKLSDLENDSDFIVDANYVHTDNNYTTEEKNKLNNLDFTNYVKNTDYANSNKGGVFKTAPSFATTVTSSGYLVNSTKTYNDYQNASGNMFVSKGTLDNVIAGKNLVSDSNYVHTDYNFTQAYKNKINNILPLIPQTRISQLVEDGVKYLKIDWDINDLIVNYQNKGKVKLFLYKYTKTGKKRWINQQTGEERYKTSVKKWVHPSNEYYPNSPSHQCWGIRSFQANPTFADDIDEIIKNSDYPIANNGLVQTEYIISAGQNSLKIPLNDIVSPILKVENTGTAQVVLPKLGDKRNVKLMGVKQKPAGSRCNQPIKFCLAVEDEVGHICIGSCLNVATIQLFKYRTDMNNHSGHGYSNGYSLLPDVGYSVFIK